MKEIELLTDAQIILGQSNKLYELLGRYSGKLPKVIENELRQEAEALSYKADKLKAKVVARLA